MYQTIQNKTQTYFSLYTFCKSSVPETIRRLNTGGQNRVKYQIRL